MAQKTTNKTQQTSINPVDFLNTIEDMQKKADCFIILGLFKELSGEEPKMWGPSIVGYGNVHYKYESGREGDNPKIGFSPRKDSITMYFNHRFDNFDELISHLGKYKLGKGCLYVKKIQDINIEVLRELVGNALQKKEDELLENN